MRKGKGKGKNTYGVSGQVFLFVSGMQLPVHHTRLSQDKFTYTTKVRFQLVEEVMATSFAGHIHCCLCEADVDAKECKSVSIMINLLKDAVVDIHGEDVAVYCDTKLCRCCHRKLVAIAKLKAHLTGRMKELRKQIE